MGFLLIVCQTIIFRVPQDGKFQTGQDSVSTSGMSRSNKYLKEGTKICGKCSIPCLYSYHSVSKNASYVRYLHRSASPFGRRRNSVVVPGVCHLWKYIHTRIYSEVPVDTDQHIFRNIPTRTLSPAESQTSALKRQCPRQ